MNLYQSSENSTEPFGVIRVIGLIKDVLNARKLELLEVKNYYWGRGTSIFRWGYWYLWGVGTGIFVLKL